MKYSSAVRLSIPNLVSEDRNVCAMSKKQTFASVRFPSLFF
jgi:hypothetical protein